MTTATFHHATPLPEAASPARKSVFARFYDALIEARMRQAMRELNMHRHLIPADMLKRAGYLATATSDGTLPFTR